MLDKNGKAYALVSEVIEGIELKTDSGFTCISSSIIKTVHKTDTNKLYITCKDGKHYLDGQIEGSINPFYMGLYKVN